MGGGGARPDGMVGAMPDGHKQGVGGADTGMDGVGETCQTDGFATGQRKDGRVAETAVVGGKDGAVADGAVTRGKEGIRTIVGDESVVAGFSLHSVVAEVSFATTRCRVGCAFHVYPWSRGRSNSRFAVTNRG